MSGANLAWAERRHCSWSPDYAWLSMLRPQTGKVLEIGPPLSMAVQDSANQTINASIVANVTFSANTLTAGIWTPPGLNQAVLIESLRAAVIETDANGKIQINLALLMTGDTINSGIPAFLSCGVLPFTQPAIANVTTWIVGENPMPLILPRPTVSANGPLVQFVITNTDASNSHTYKRNITYSYRIISNCDFTAGPTIPGSGIGQ